MNVHNIENKLMSAYPLPESVIKCIDLCLLKFPTTSRRSATLAALKFTQDFNGGFLTTELIEGVAFYLNLPCIFVYEVVSFYSMYHIGFKAKHKVSVCTSITCSQLGSDDIVNHIRNKYGIDSGMVSSDGNIFFTEVECLALCDQAPILQIGTEYYTRLNTKELDSILTNLR
jgi:NADH-quinone oxidoreductase subunit E